MLWSVAFKLFYFLTELTQEKHTSSKKLAISFQEDVIDFGPIAIIHNYSYRYDVGDIEVQLWGRGVLHFGFATDFIVHFLSLEFIYEQQ